ncbi:hypothetical protein DPMN_138541 [Dreissena polymorpha]|uniref:Uncharacterized protein n=1 Tax=Dreissena polymorpha TaxID=45954 RepID=A0A9D4JFQ5_DREPO|nr:hypothetical protein DPMN_138541 [Dreissena polymorpha]
MKFMCACSAVVYRQPSAMHRHTYVVRVLHIHRVGTENVPINTQVHDGVLHRTAHQNRITRPYTVTTRFLYVLIRDCSRRAFKVSYMYKVLSILSVSTSVFLDWTYVHKLSSILYFFTGNVTCTKSDSTPSSDIILAWRGSSHVLTTI